MSRAEPFPSDPREAGRSPVRLHVVFDNVARSRTLEASWGFACLVDGFEQTILFDTGSDGDVLLANLDAMGIDPATVEAVVLSHHHWDHVDGLPALLDRDPRVTVYSLPSFPDDFHRRLRRVGVVDEVVQGPGALMRGVYSTGEMAGETPEQALVLDTSSGLVVITGCAHPDVAAMAERATTLLGERIHLLMGGFHLRDHAATEIAAIIARLDALGVEKVAPSHCTGELAVRLFREHWGDDFVEGGLGAVIGVEN